MSKKFDEAGWRYCIYTGKECCRCNRCQTPIIINNEPPKQSGDWFLKILLGLVILTIIFVALCMIPFFGHVQDPILMQEPVNNYYTSSSSSSNYELPNSYTQPIVEKIYQEVPTYISNYQSSDTFQNLTPNTY